MGPSNHACTVSQIVAAGRPWWWAWGLAGSIAQLVTNCRNVGRNGQSWGTRCIRSSIPSSPMSLIPLGTKYTVMSSGNRRKPVHQDRSGKQQE